MTKPKQPETVYFSPQILMSVDDITTALEGASRDFIFALIVALEASLQDAEFLERVFAHFDAELKKQNAA
jgi:hypothetical protein